MQCFTAFNTENNTVATDTYRYYRYVLIHGKRDDNDNNNQTKQVYSLLKSKILGFSQRFC